MKCAGRLEVLEGQRAIQPDGAVGGLPIGVDQAMHGHRRETTELTLWKLIVSVDGLLEYDVHLVDAGARIRGEQSLQRVVGPGQSS